MKHDTLEEQRIIITAAEIARGAEKIGPAGLREIDGRQAAVWQPQGAGRASLDVAGIKIDDPQTNWIGIWIHLSEARPWHRFWILLCSERWPEGWQEPQAYTTNILVDWRGWKFVELPVDHFGRHGDIPSLCDVTMLRINHTPGAVDPHLVEQAPPPQVALGGIEVATQIRPEGPRISIDELVDDLAIYLSQGRPAEEALLEYFSKRAFPVFESFAGDLSWDPSDPDVLVTANRIMEEDRWRVFDLSLKDGANPWLCLPGVTGDETAPWGKLHNHSWLTPLCVAYEQTGELRYLEKGRDLLLDWIRRVPVPQNTDGGTGASWGGLAPRSRGMMWTRVYEIFLDAGVLDAEQHGIFLRAIWETAHLLDNRPFKGFNFALFREASLLLLTVHFPEFASLRKLQERVLGIIDEELRLELFPDGFQKELSTGYQIVVARVAEVLAHARKTGCELEVPFRPQLERAFQVWMDFSRPDGTCVSVNDAQSCNRDYFFCLNGGAKLFGREDFTYITSYGKEGVRPDHTSFRYPYAGYYIMRSGWDMDDRFLLFDGGPVGINHRHEDKLNFDMYAWGQRFIVDPGIHLYGPNPFQGFFGDTMAHNTIVVDGLGQDRRHNPADWTVAEPLNNLWQHGDVLDIVQAEYDRPYKTMTQDPRIKPKLVTGLVHTRTVLFARPDYFVILDQVSGAGEHTCEPLFHFAPLEVSLQPDGEVMATGDNGAVLHLMPLLKQGLSSARICGAMDPVQGWVVVANDSGHEPVAAPVLLQKKQGPLPLHFATVLYPLASAEEAKPGCTVIAQDDAGISFKVEASGRCDEWHVAFSDQYSYNDARLEWTGKALLLSTAGDNARKVAAVNTARLMLDGEALLEKPAEFMEW